MKMSNKVYDILKYVALIALPGIATLYGVLASIWGLPYADEVPSTIIAVDTCLGTLLCISSETYKRGE